VSRPHGAPQTTYLLLAAACFAGFTVSLIINYPGYMTYDSILQILEAREGVYSDWHPPFMAFIWHFTNKVIPGPFGMLILQTMLVWSGTFLIAVYFFADKQRPLLALTPCLLVFYPAVFGISGAIWKDILMWGFLLLAIGVAGTINASSPVTSYRSIAKLTALSFALLAGLLCRHNAAFAVIPLIALAAARSIGPAPGVRKLAAASLIGGFAFAAILLGSIFVNSILTTYKTTMWNQVAFFDIAGVIYRLPDKNEQTAIYQSIPARLRGNGSLENLLLTYSPENWGTMVLGEHPAFRSDPSKYHETAIRDDITEQEATVLGRLWIETIIHHPFAWVEHRFDVFKEVIGLTHHDLRSAVAMRKQYPDWLGAAYGRVDPEPNRLQISANWLLTHLSWHFIFRPWLYLLITTCVLLGCLIFPTPERMQCAFIAASGFAYEASLFLFAPAADFRYSHYMIYISLLASLLLARTIRFHRRAAKLESEP